MKLCNPMDPVLFNSATMRAAIYGWKNIVHDEGAYYGGAEGFAMEGYTRQPSPLANDEPFCLIDAKNKVTETRLPWNWTPHHRISLYPPGITLP